MSALESQALSCEPAIAGLSLRPLKVLGDERGAVFHHLRADDPWFESFGEVYSSMVLPGMVKAWKRHQRMSQNLVVPQGAIKFVVYDDRADSPSAGIVAEIHIGRDNYQLLHVPPMVWYGFVGCGDESALIVNCASIPHDPAEVDRRPVDTPDIPYTW